MLPTMTILVRFRPPSDLHSGGADDVVASRHSQPRDHGGPSTLPG